jgi:hypothetical protein
MSGWIKKECNYSEAGINLLSFELFSSGEYFSVSRAVSSHKFTIIT